MERFESPVADLQLEFYYKNEKNEKVFDSLSNGTDVLPSNSIYTSLSKKLSNLSTADQIFVITLHVLITIISFKTKFIIIISPLNAQWRTGHQQVASIPVGPLQAVKLAPR